MDRRSELSEIGVRTRMNRLVEDRSQNIRTIKCDPWSGRVGVLFGAVTEVWSTKTTVLPTAKTNT